MNLLRTRKTARDSSSSVEIRLHAPKEWHELSQKELRYALTLMANGFEGVSLKTFMLIRFNKIQVVRRSKDGWKLVKDKQVFYADKWLITSLVDGMKFVDRYENFDARLDSVQGFRAVNGLLNGVPFNDYLKMEIAYQLYNKTNDDMYLVKLARLLYRDDKGRPANAIEPDKAEILGVFLWYAHIKDVFSRLFPELFRKVGNADGGVDDMDMRSITDAQLRLLTDGDVTKEAAVRQVDCKRALTELNAKAREAREMKAKLNNK